MINKRDFILRGSCFCERYISHGKRTENIIPRVLRIGLGPWSALGLELGSGLVMFSVLEPYHTRHFNHGWDASCFI